MTLDVFFFVDDARTQSVLVGLSLKDLFFDCSSRNESVNEANLLLAITPYASKCLAIIRGVPEYIMQKPVKYQSGSKRTSLFAPTRFNPHPPALEDSKKTNSLDSGSLNFSTSAIERLARAYTPCLLGIDRVPSSLRLPHCFARHSFSKRSSVCV